MNSTNFNAPKGVINPARLPFDAITTYDTNLTLIGDNGPVHIPLTTKTAIAMVLPTKSTGRALRRCWEAKSRLITLVMDDSQELGGARGPAAFNDVTVKWALRNADYIAVWACGMGADQMRRVTEGLGEAKNACLILTNAGHETAWVDLVQKWKKPKSRVDFLMIEGSRVSDDVEAIVHAADRAQIVKMLEQTVKKHPKAAGVREATALLLERFDASEDFRLKWNEDMCFRREKVLGALRKVSQ